MIIRDQDSECGHISPAQGRQDLETRVERKIAGQILWNIFEDLAITPCELTLGTVPQVNTAITVSGSATIAIFERSVPRGAQKRVGRVPRVPALLTSRPAATLKHL